MGHRTSPSAMCAVVGRGCLFYLMGRSRRDANCKSGTGTGGPGLHLQLAQRPADSKPRQTHTVDRKTTHSSVEWFSVDRTHT